MEREDKRGIFFGVVGVLTLIVAIIGASLAWFSINVSSKKDALIVESASVQIAYLDGNKLKVENLIPSTKAIALKTLSRYLNKETYTTDDGQVPYQKCVDDNNHVVCGVYNFSLTNNGVNPAELIAKVLPSELVAGEDGKEPVKFKNLMYTMFDITDVAYDEELQEYTGTGTPIEISEGVVDGTVTYEEFSILPNATKINGNGDKRIYRLFVWLDEKEDANNSEQGAKFHGTVLIDVKGSGNITGTVTGE